MTTYIWEQSSYLTGADGKPVIIIIGRDTTTNKTKSFGVKGFTPYFYAEDPNGDVVSCHNTKLRKIECRHPQEVVAKRQYFESTYDADIPYDMRYLIDNDIYYAFDENLKPVDAPVHLPRVLYYDIEIYIKDGSMPDPTRPDWEIVSISCRDSYTGKMRAFTLTEKKVNRYQVCCKSEEELLHKFMDFVLKYDFDVLAGWYSSGFDWLYIVNRAKKLRVDMSRLSRIPSQRVGPTRVPGRILADMLDLFKDWSKPLGQQPAYDLKSISRDPRFGDFDYDDFGASIPDLIEGDDWATLVQYSLNDVISLAKIDKKCGIFQFYEGIRRLTGIKLDNCLMKTRIIETFLMRNCKYPLPTRTMHEKEDFEGAYVVKPEMGIHEWVGGFDLAALYPSIIVAYNISPDAFNMIPSTIVKMMAERERLRAKRLSGEGGVTLATTEQSLKYIINSFYGVMGYKSFKLFDMECAKRIPKLGQDINRGIHAFLESEGYDIIYGDSVAGDTLIRINGDDCEIQSLFKRCDNRVGKKEYYYPSDIYSDTLDHNGNCVSRRILSVMRHKVTKQMYRVYLNDDWYIDVTEDHSLFKYMFNSQKLFGDRLTLVTPANLISDRDYLITWVNPRVRHIVGDYYIYPVHQIEKLPQTNQYVYDLEIEDTHRFFANDILVHNTDSSYIYPIKDAESGLKVQSALNEYLRNWAEGMGVKRELAPRIKLEEIYRTIFFKKSKTGGGAAKKRYAGHVVWTDSDGYDVPPDKLDIKGFEIKRSDQAALTKELMSKVFHLLLIEDKPDDAIALIKDTYLEVYRGERTIAECAIPSAVKSDANSPHLRGMRAAEWLLGITWQGYEKPQLLYCRRPVPEICIPNGWTGDAFDEHIIVDWGLQADKIVKMKMEMIMESLGYSWAKSVDGQMSLADFM